MSYQQQVLFYDNYQQQYQSNTTQQNSTSRQIHYSPQVRQLYQETSQFQNYQNSQRNCQQQNYINNNFLQVVYQNNQQQMQNETYQQNNQYQRIDYYQNNMSNQQKQFDNLEQLIQKQLDKIQELSKQKQYFEIKITQYEYYLSSYSKQFDNLKVKLIDNVQQIQEDQRQQVSQKISQEIINRQEQEIKELKQKNQEIINHYQQTLNYLQQSQQKQYENEQLKNKELQSQLIQSEQQIYEIQNKNKIESLKLIEYIKDLQKQLENQQQQNQRNDQLQYLIESKNQQIQDLNNTLNQYENQMKQKEQECQTQVFNNKQLKIKLNELEQQLQLNVFQQQLSKPNNELQQLNQILNKQDNKIQELQSLYGNEKKIKEQLQSKLTQNETIMKDYQQKYQNQLEKFREQLNNNAIYEQQIFQLRQENSSLANLSKVSEKEQLQKQISQLQVKKHTKQQIIQLPIQLEHYNSSNYLKDKGLTSILLGVTGVGKTMLMNKLFDNKLSQLYQPIKLDELNCYFTDTESFDFDDIDKREDQIIQYRKLFQSNYYNINNLFILVNFERTDIMKQKVMCIYKYIKAFQPIISIVVTNFHLSENELEDSNHLKEKFKLFTDKIIFIKNNMNKQQLLEIFKSQGITDVKFKMNLEDTIFEDVNPEEQQQLMEEFTIKLKQQSVKNSFY